MKIDANTIVGDIVKESYKVAPVLENHKIDFCCGGNISLDEACSKASVDVKKLIPQLEEVMQEEDFDARFIQSLEPDQLADYIEKRHHTYVREKIPFLKGKLEKLCSVHGQKHPELFDVARLFDESAENLSMHMMKEELVLFPQIRKLVKAKKGGNVDLSHLQGVESPIKVMLAEHNAEGDRFRTISEITDGYRTPDDGCNTYEVTMRTLQEFEEDLHRHIHLENNILFPAALRLEEELGA
ncbi:iron-sulfur cluster repair di-iron protein [Anaerophaga thermohalophila]|uniref:iron-sulfur cluster repair di-iron protein n=1 Tax=Anaerophaga thermohalophila TaxID=177400 RepID=UPI00030BBC09|nr:iron-sulfur cluster repair di-iron protein [Anaerophaga thermohalophila]